MTNVIESKKNAVA